MAKFILSCESTVDLSYSYIQKRDIPVLFYSYIIDGCEYPDDMSKNPENLQQFYASLRQGKMPKTSQLVGIQYEDFFERLLKEGDVLHIAFGSGMTASVQNAIQAADYLNSIYKDHKVTVIDSLCSSSGYGMLVDYAADLRDAGKTMQETASWVYANRLKVHHQFFSTELDFYRRSGRMSGPAAAIATIIGICPIMRLNNVGKIIAYSKAHGKKKAMAVTLSEMEKHAEGGLGYNGKCFICHSDCESDALRMKELVAQKFPNISGDIRICDIGTIIASHCGPGTVAVFFLGDERAPG